MTNNKQKRNKNLKPWKNRLSLTNFLKKTGLIEVASRAVRKNKANKYVKKHPRDKLIVLFIILIVIAYKPIQLDMTDATYVAILINHNQMPSKSTISKTWAKLLNPLEDICNYYMDKVYSRISRVYREAREILIIDIKAIKTRSRHAKVGYIHGRKAKGIKIHMSTINTVPWIFVLTPANVHDSEHLLYFAKKMRERLGGEEFLVTGDRAFSAFKNFIEIRKLNAHLVAPYKKNMKGFKYLETVKTKLGKAYIFTKKYMGETIYLVKLMDDFGRTWRLLSTLNDPELVVRAYRIRWSIEVLFRNMANLNFRLLGHTYEAITASIYLYLIAYLILMYYSMLIRRRFSIANFLRAFRRWIHETFLPLYFSLEANISLTVRPPPRA